MTEQYKSHMDKPYEKFMKSGAESLTDAELLAIIIRTGTREEDSVTLGQRILHLGNQQHGLLGLHHLSLADLMTIRGIGMVKAVKIKCITELSTRMSKATAALRLQLTKPDTVADYYMEELRHIETEHIILVMLDNKNRLIQDYVISKGTVNASLISPREVFLTALRYQAVSILLLHNHPSGDPTPSKQDISITERITETAKMIGIPLIDHIIIGDNKYMSFKEAGLL